MKVYGGGTKRSGGRIKPPDLFDAFRYAQSLPNVATMVVGMYGEEEMKENLHFAHTYTPFSQQEMADLLARGKRLAPSWGKPYGAKV